MDDMRKGVCPLCSNREILETTPCESLRDGGDFVPLSAHKQSAGFIHPFANFGSFMTYICRRCGYAQWFASNPVEIPIAVNEGGHHPTRLITGLEPDSPYR
jgi:hypothetical protein